MPSSRHSGLVAVTLLLTLGAPRTRAADVLVERVLAAVNETPVLLSDVRLLAALRGLEQQAALNAAIDERLMFQEAVRLAPAPIGAREEQAAYESLKARVAGNGSTRLSEPGLRRLARTEATILRYVEFRFRPQVRVGDEAVRAAYQQETGAQTAPSSFEERAPALRERLEQQALDERLETWIHGLRASGDVRYVLRAGDETLPVTQGAP